MPRSATTIFWEEPKLGFFQNPETRPTESLLSSGCWHVGPDDFERVQGELFARTNGEKSDGRAAGRFKRLLITRELYGIEMNA
jgi:hypothetical protein